MPPIRKYKKIKSATVLIKRSQCLRNYPKNKSYKPLCEKLKSNNSSLARALSKEKQESQLLFSQNVALTAEVHDLGLACSKRDDAIVNILKNAKEMLKILVTATGYLTNTISSCQEFAATYGTNLRMSCSSAGRRESYRRLSTKSPTKGVVKPMVSGHTITKPTVSLSRVNTQHINNPSNLSIIEEVSTPPRNQELSSPVSPAVVSVTQRRYENGRTNSRRMPERLAVSSPRSSEENERRLSKRSSRHSGRISGKRSRPKSGRLSGNNSTRTNVENFEYIGSPRVKLNDVSKLLQDSQSINIRMLTENRNNQRTVSPEDSDVNREDTQIGVTIPETPPSDTPKDDNDKTIENQNEQIDNELNSTDEQMKRNSSEVQNNTSNWEDPLEGPSWLFNNLLTVPCFTNKEKKTEDVNVSADSMSVTLKATESSDESDSEKCIQLTSTLPMVNKRGSQAHSSKKGKQICHRNESTGHQHNASNDTLCNTSTSTAPTDGNQNGCKTESEPTVNLTNFVTQRRVYFEAEDDDDFTLMFERQPRNMHFDINDLKLPVLEESALKPIVPTEPEPEVTTNLRKISQICPIPSVSNNTLDETAFNESTVNLPLLIVNEYDNKDLTSCKDKSESFQRNKRVKKVTKKNLTEFNDSTPTFKKKNNQKKKKDNPVNRDPSSAKVVLQKLNESDVKSRTPSPEEITFHDSNQSLSPVSSRADNSSDSESSNTSTSSIYALNRPKRKRVLTSFQEPNLKKKLRRNH